MIFDLLDIILITVYIYAITIYIRIFLKGYKLALWPVASLICYIILEFDWVFSKQVEHIGTLRDVLWILVEMFIALTCSLFAKHLAFKG